MLLGLCFGVGGSVLTVWCVGVVLLNATHSLCLQLLISSILLLLDSDYVVCLPLPVNSGESIAHNNNQDPVCD